MAGAYWIILVEQIDITTRAESEIELRSCCCPYPAQLIGNQPPDLVHEAGRNSFGRSNKISIGESYRLIQITAITKRIARQMQLTAFLRLVKAFSASCPVCLERFS